MFPDVLFNFVALDFLCFFLIRFFVFDKTFETVWTFLPSMPPCNNIWCRSFSLSLCLFLSLSASLSLCVCVRVSFFLFTPTILYQELAKPISLNCVCDKTEFRSRSPFFHCPSLFTLHCWKVFVAVGTLINWNKYWHHLLEISCPTN